MIAIKCRKRFDRYITFSREWITVGDGKSPPLTGAAALIARHVSYYVRLGQSWTTRWNTVGKRTDDSRSFLCCETKSWQRCQLFKMFINNARRPIKIIMFGCKRKEKEKQREGANPFVFWGEYNRCYAFSQPVCAQLNPSSVFAVQPRNN